ncbi:MAG: hypothetical protein GWP04_00150 [Gammaproteobacteria bacterium]|nr:hypothetical protein [Gammaproteobacteria bacterium]
MALIRRIGLIFILLLVASCATNRYGPWYTPAGNIVSNSIMVEFEGFKDCGTDKVVFIRFLGRQYAHDREGQLGTLTAPDGTVLTYAELDGPPAGSEATGVRHQDREIWRDSADIENYLYIVYDSGFTQRWPRAEVRCER